MRQRHIKQATVEYMQSLGVLTEPTLLDFDPNQKVHLEIGSGKGQFITKLAQDFKDDIFIALEIDKDVCFRIVEKKVQYNLNNLIILLTNANTLDLWIKPHQVDFIYLNFSDPWPKARHHKRRLTWPTKLKTYQQILKPKGILQFRTDSLELFEDSITYFENHFDIYDVQMDLMESPYMTEYEEKKRKIGRIYQLKGRCQND
jgi:tRNA (guanine-N7-)-methyltransferase